ncbi:MAG TPA: hypothetical protein VN843_09010, partial [Anaerolineales bacterium]|nr:hypothetical protein [Anaerolineales bacterium]
MRKNFRIEEPVPGIQLTKHFKQARSQINRLSWSPDGNKLAFGDDETVYVWDVFGGDIKEIEVSSDFIFDVAWSNDNEALAIATNRELFLCRFESEGGPVLDHLLYDFVYSVEWSPDGQLLASSSANRTISILDPETSTIRQFSGHRSRVYCSAWSPDGKSIASCSQDKTIRLWNFRDRPPKIFTGH